MREQALQKKLDEVSAEASTKESAQSARILDLETKLSAATADLERHVCSYMLSNILALCIFLTWRFATSQISIVQSADDKAEAELAKLAEARLALADKGFVSSDSEGGDGVGDDFVEADDAPVYTGPTSFASTQWGAQAEGQAVAAAEQLRQEAEAERAAKQAQKAERRRKRALKKAERERIDRGERQPGQY